MHLQKKKQKTFFDFEMFLFSANLYKVVASSGVDIKIYKWLFLFWNSYELLIAYMATS
jgi:hypothetical protein